MDFGVESDREDGRTPRGEAAGRCPAQPGPDRGGRPPSQLLVADRLGELLPFRALRGEAFAAEGGQSIDPHTLIVLGGRPFGGDRALTLDPENVDTMVGMGISNFIALAIIITTAAAV